MRLRLKMYIKAIIINPFITFAFKTVMRLNGVSKL